MWVSQLVASSTQQLGTEAPVALHHSGNIAAYLLTPAPKDRGSMTGHMCCLPALVFPFATPAAGLT